MFRPSPQRARQSRCRIRPALAFFVLMATLAASCASEPEIVVDRADEVTFCRWVGLLGDTLPEQDDLRDESVAIVLLEQVAIAANGAALAAPDSLRAPFSLVADFNQAVGATYASAVPIEPEQRAEARGAASEVERIGAQRCGVALDPTQLLAYAGGTDA